MSTGPAQPPNGSPRSRGVGVSEENVDLYRKLFDAMTLRRHGRS
jgi:hypothetical protein